MKRIFVVMLVLAATSVGAQRKGMPLEGSVQAGLLEGELGSAFQLNVSGGIKLNTWSAAIGSGLDYYGVRSIPLFLNVQKRLFNRQQTPFAYISGGHHFPWASKQEERVWGSWMPEPAERKGSLYYSGGIGYQLPALKRAALFFTAGYSFKEHREITKRLICPFLPPCFETVETVNYRFRRLSISTGLRF